MVRRNELNKLFKFHFKYILIIQLLDYQKQTNTVSKETIIKSLISFKLKIMIKNKPSIELQKQ
jgi:hypothetical protein